MGLTVYYYETQPSDHIHHTERYDERIEIEFYCDDPVREAYEDTDPDTDEHPYIPWEMVDQHQIGLNAAHHRRDRAYGDIEPPAYKADGLGRRHDADYRYMNKQVDKVLRIQEIRRTESKIEEQTNQHKDQSVITEKILWFFYEEPYPGSITVRHLYFPQNAETLPPRVSSGYPDPPHWPALPQ